MRGLRPRNRFRPENTTQKADYLMVLPVRHFRIDHRRVAVESAFAQHLRMMRMKIGEASDRLLVGSPSMAKSVYEANKRGLSTINEAPERIVFAEIFSDSANQVRLRLFWSVMRNVYRLVQQSNCVHSGFSWDVKLPYEFAAIVFGLLSKRRTVFVVDIDFRQSAYMSYRNGDFSLKSYLVCKFWHDPKLSVQLRIATRYCSVVLLKGRKLTADFGNGKSNVKNFLDASHSEDNIIETPALREKLRTIRCLDTPLKVIYFGRLTAYKGVDRCLRAVAAARQAGSNVTLDILGDGVEEKALRELTQDLAATSCVTFHAARPFDQDFFRFLYGFHLLLAAPLREDTPRSALDAMAAGIPYLAFDTYYYRQLLESGAGEIVPWPDIEAMTRSLIMLAGDRERIVKMVENAVAFARLNTQEIWLERRLAWTRGESTPEGNINVQTKKE